jgi:hypothetical protein
MLQLLVVRPLPVQLHQFYLLLLSLSHLFFLLIETSRSLLAVSSRILSTFLPPSILISGKILFKNVFVSDFTCYFSIEFLEPKIILPYKLALTELGSPKEGKI